MSFLTNHLLKKLPFKALPELIATQTASIIKDSQAKVDSLTKGTNWHYPDGLSTLSTLDSVSNECCKIIDSGLIVYKNYSEGNEVLKKTLENSSNDINDFFGGEYLNLNKRLYTMLLQI